MSNLDVGLEQRQVLTLSQQQRQSFKILTMPALELWEFVGKALEDNPVLEPDEEYTAAPMHNDGEYAPEPYESQRGRPMDRTLREELLFQLTTSGFSLPEGLGEYLIDCLDSDGYLRMDDEELAQATGLPIHVIAAAVRDLQGLDPAGVFARDLAECLLMQLRARAERNPVAEQICASCLVLAGANKLAQIAQKLCCEVNEVKEALALIKELSPRPGSNFSSEKTHYIVPDLRVTVREHELSVTALAGACVHINSYYTDRLARVDQNTCAYLRHEITRGKTLISCLEQRRRTLLAVARAAVYHQTEYFVSGRPLRPLTMAELALLLEVHESTVSRAVSGKYLRYNGGTLPLSRLFCGSLESGGSAESAKRSLAQLVAQEDRAHPLSDEKLAALLAQDGIVLSRRAVAKYRDALGILPSHARKE